MKEEVKISTHNAVTVLDIPGDVTIASESALNEAYKSACDNGAGNILLKFAHDAYINSGGIALLIQLLAQARKNNQRIGIAGLSDHFKKIFNMVGITKFAKIHNSLEEALNEMRDA